MLADIGRFDCFGAKGTVLTRSEMQLIKKLRCDASNSSAKVEMS